MDRSAHPARGRPIADPAVPVRAALPDVAGVAPVLAEERISVATAAGVLKTWTSAHEDRAQLFLDLSRALLDVLTFYGNTAGTFFHGTHEREEWRTIFGVFIDGLWTAVRGVDA